jgi:predicted site-specific integrase-resolvase
MLTNVIDQLLTENEAAGILRVSLSSVRRWRREGCGPTYRKVGRTVRYRSGDLTDFIAASRRTETGWRGRQPAAA